MNKIRTHDLSIEFAAHWTALSPSKILLVLSWKSHQIIQLFVGDELVVVVNRSHFALLHLVRDVVQERTPPLTKKSRYQKIVISFPFLTECVTDLDSRLEMIIFESILTTFEATIFWGSWGSSWNQLEPTNYEF